MSLRNLVFCLDISAYWKAYGPDFTVNELYSDTRKLQWNFGAKLMNACCTAFPESENVFCFVDFLPDNIRNTDVGHYDRTRERERGGK